MDIGTEILDDAMMYNSIEDLGIAIIEYTTIYNIYGNGDIDSNEIFRLATIIF